jgi:glyoxalase family protein
MGAGQGHHYALAVADEDTQLHFRDRLLEAGHHVSPIMDRIYFKSIYTKDPDGHIVELATMGPGFLVDESADRAGTGLQLPPWLEAHREQIADQLRDIDRVQWPYDGGDGATGMRGHPGRRLDVTTQVETNA